MVLSSRIFFRAHGSVCYCQVLLYDCISVGFLQCFLPEFHRIFESKERLQALTFLCLISASGYWALNSRNFSVWVFSSIWFTCGIYRCIPIHFLIISLLSPVSVLDDHLTFF